MDLVTQTVLGAAVGELVLGRKAGNKAIAWGAVGGLVPDLDVLITPLFSEVNGLFVHRGFSHSIIFAFLLAPLLGWLIHRIHRKKMDVTKRQWTKLVFWAAFTHPILDYFTTYGTGAFLPFSGYRVEWGTIGIIDIFYTLPFILALFILPFLKRTSTFRRQLIVATVGITSFYLLATVANKLHVNSVFKEAFVNKEISHERYRTSPLPLTNFLWMGIAEVDSGYYMGLYSNFDSNKPTDFMFIPRNENKLASISDNEQLKKLIRFSKGYYHVGEDQEGLFLADLRFGMMGTVEEPVFIFKFNLKNEDSNLQIDRATESRTIEKQEFSDFIERIKGL